MSIWERGKKLVADTFFFDKIELYANAIVKDNLGEELNKEVLVGTYDCNIQNNPNIVTNNESGAGSPQVIRISLSKETPLDYRFTYKVKIIKARVIFNSQEFWKVDGWTESQLSTVINASREVSV